MLKSHYKSVFHPQIKDRIKTFHFFYINIVPIKNTGIIYLEIGPSSNDTNFCLCQWLIDFNGMPNFLGLFYA